MPRATTTRSPRTGSAMTAESPPAAPEATQERTVQSHDFSWFWRSYTVSIFGDQITLVALPIAVFARTQSALSVGIVASMLSLTTLLFGLLAGALADRLQHRAVLIATDLVRAAVLAFLAVLVLSA